MGKGVPADAETGGLSSALSGKSSELRDSRSRPLITLRLLQSGNELPHSKTWKRDGSVVYTLDLDAADALILR